VAGGSAILRATLAPQNQEQMNKTHLALVGVVFLVVTVGVFLLWLEGARHRQIVQKCKTLRLGMTEHEIIAVLGQPARKATEKQANTIIERLFFEPSGIMPNVAAQSVLCEINVSTKRAVRIICDEDFHLRNGETQGLEKKGSN
jgi:hypothetical protein